MKTCGSCALKALKDGKCPIFNKDMSGADGCPLHTSVLLTCDVCGGVLLGPPIFEWDNEKEVVHQMCQNCGTDSSCRTCSSKECKFNDDESCPEPPYVMVEKRQGNMFVQTQMLNPKRVMATCAQGCSCFDEEGLDSSTFCRKTQNCGCKNYKTNWRK